ncbi:MBL fold metallo-hydrolase [Actinoplanes missouriensis]|uniref:MBL fold metallo-hydrolase n=1 Tax=Actinoplanes missouriensis TaxID=1866 RepID=UPI0033D43B2A
MLTRVADGVHVHTSGFLLSNAVVVQGRDGVLLVDPGVQESELLCLADDLAAAGQRVVAGFSTHADWDHVLWIPRLGDAPRYGTARAAAAMSEQLAAPGAKEAIAEHLTGTEVAGQVPMDLLGQITALPAGTTHIPWDGPPVRIVEHQGHAPGHAFLVIEQSGVLVAGDMLSDVLVPMLDTEAADPVEDYLAGVRLLDEMAGDAAAVVPGHGTVGGAGETRARIELDLAYVLALRTGGPDSDPRIGPAARPGWEWVTDLHNGQVGRLHGRSR